MHLDNPLLWTRNDWRRTIPTPPLPNHQLNLLGWLLLPLATLLIIHLTLEPYNFALGAIWFATEPSALWRTFLSGKSGALDVINNYVLFMPLGFSIACILRRAPWFVGMLAALVAGALLSLSVELLQLFLPERTSTIIDVRSNSIGSMLGWGTWLLAALWLRSRRTLKIWLGLYLGLALLAVVLVPVDSRLADWDRSYTLNVGNEQSGDRPWKGTVSRLLIVDRAIDGDEAHVALTGEEGTPPLSAGALLADYAPFAGGLVDRTGQQQELRPRPAPAETTWLATAEATLPLTERIARTSQFTVAATVTSASPSQFGPARIVSLSGGIAERNLTLGQQGDDLIIRLRNPLTGVNGTWPELRASDVFATMAQRQLVVTYDGSQLRLFVDGDEYPISLRFTRAWALVQYILPPEILSKLSMSQPIIHLLSIWLPSLIVLLCIYVPAGLLLANLHTAQPAGTTRRTWARTGASALALLTLFQGGTALAGGTLNAPVETALGFVLLGIAFAVFRWLYFGRKRVSIVA